MALFGRRKETKGLRSLPGAPQAPFGSVKRHREFVAVATQELNRRGWSYELGDQHLHVTEPRDLVIGLAYLAGLCEPQPRDEWGGAVGAYLDEVAEQPADTQPGLVFAQARDTIKIALWGLPGLAGTTMIMRPVASDLASVVVADLPGGIRRVGPAEAEAWSVTADELFELGLANLAAEQTPDQETVELADQASFRAWSAESSFVASRVLELERLVGELDQWGAVVGLPRRDTLLCHPIYDLSVGKAVQGLVSGVHRLFDAGPEPLSAHLYWWRAGQLTLLPTVRHDEGVGFDPPDEFVELLSRLPAVGQ